jgi:hypothetical protein
MMGGDLSHVAPALVALGLSPAADNGSRESKTGESITASGDPVHTSGSASAGPVDNITAGSDMVPDGVGDDLHAGPDGFQNAPQKTKKTQADKRTTKQKKSNTSQNNDLCEGVGGQGGKNNPECGAGMGPECCQGNTDDIETDVNPHALPAGLYDDITATIENYCRQYDINEPLKMHPSQWKSLCIYIGQGIKGRAILQDKSRYKEVGFCYDGERVAALLDLYEYTCGQYKQVPFAYNFMHFAGISRQYFADYGDRLTSGRVNLRQKAYEIQRAGLVEAVTGGGSATVGNIFLSKALGGLQETVTIQHVSAASTPAAVALPVFGPDGGLLEDKRPE